MLEDFLAEPSKGNLNALLGIYLLAVFALLTQQWTSRRAVGLPTAYTFSFSMMHAIGALVYALPWYSPRSEYLLQSGASLANTHAGFRMACFGYVFFVLGVLLAPMVFSKDPAPKAFYADKRITTNLAGTLLIISFLAFFAAPVLSRIPSMGSMGTAGAFMSVVAVFIYCHRAYRLQDTGRFILGLTSTVGFPFVTIIFLGFAGYGSTAASMVWMFVLRFFRPRWLSLLVLGVILYGGLSFYVNWMRERESIRSSVWGARSMEHRLDRLYDLAVDFEPLDLHKQLHLELIDSRLNQNDLCGKAYRYLAQGKAEFAKGYTLWVAAVAWVPRIIWPGKPVTGGSGGVVTHFTGQRFSEGTSVGAGNVLEFYVNFGWWGLMVSFFALGLALSWFDRRGAFHYERGDYWTATRWILPGLGLIQPGGLSAEMTGSCAAYAVFAFILHKVFFQKFYDVGDQMAAGRGSYPAPVARPQHPVKPLPGPRYPGC